jgi:quinol monooxygenase YgiN
VPHEVEVIAIIQSKPGREQVVAEILETCVTPSRAEAGCRLYTLYRDQADACRFVFVERWADQTALSAHEQSPHFLELINALPPHVANESRAMVLERVA